ncbi:putrescine transport system permease protein [Palleronia marisminoris]|uniref:Putrescine transport system permease protein PotH n=1 Tax=Palleronia marisminoris TaxID=315423 RepID=A0A1Y5RF92_9RHOB|nr:ABC transporter permease subunit [Palleronia marisminoris]SFG10853.1 putrescine transport system permease protein [Palleronia marisminoris]SLN13464.1 Putrescine transport system permease protein PotH [Palleronia marisminoris]
MRRLVPLVPFLWLGLFFVIPFAVLLKISFSEPAIAMPPYLPLWEWADGVLTIAINLGNYIFLTEDPLYLVSYLSSVRIAAISTLVTLLIGYPMAYAIARAPEGRRNILLMLVILPFWTSFLLRVYAWIGILKANGVLNNALMSLGLIDQPLVILQTDIAVYLGIVYTYLPFMILPLYATLSRLDGDLLEASADLGARPLTTFATVTLPLSMPGVLAGSMLVFIPAVGEYVIPALLGGPDTLMIGTVLWNEFFLNRDWPVASAVAIVMVLVLALPIALLRRIQSRAEKA